MASVEACGERLVFRARFDERAHVAGRLPCDYKSGTVYLEGVHARVLTTNVQLFQHGHRAKLKQ